MAIGISPTVDFAFKRLLGNPAHTEITIHFLNAVLEGGPRITHVDILNPALDKETAYDKLGVLDVCATDEHGRLLNIEMQTGLPQSLAERLVYYAACLYVGQLEEGIDYTTIRPAISICVLTEAMFPHLSDMHFDFRLRERVHPLTLTEKLQIHLLELPKCLVGADNVSVAPAIDKWAYFLKHAESLTPQEIVRQLPEREFAAAAGILEMIAKSPEERTQYESRLKFQRDVAARLAQAKLDGRTEGHAEGQALGEVRGEVKGRIRLLQQQLGLPAATGEALAGLDLAQLETIESDLQRQYRERFAHGGKDN